MHFALYGRSFKPGVDRKIKELLSRLSCFGSKISCFSGLVPYLSEHSLLNMINGEIFHSHDDLPSSVDMLFSLGGDGTFLNSLSVIRNSGKPVAGINFGRLGFLTSTQVGNDENGLSGIDSILNGKFDLVDKKLLEVSCPELPEDFYKYALNEICIQRQDPYMIGIHVKVDGKSIPDYWADGLLVATCTGSTAYSLSIGGPVVVPGSSVFIISPIAAHNLNVRPVIVPDTSVIEISIISREHPVFLSADNSRIVLNTKETIKVTKAPFTLKCVSLGNFNFFDALNEKLLWGADLRNESHL